MMNNMQFSMKARIDEVDFINGKNYSLVTVPAVDAYSKPSTYRLQSDQALGNVGAEIDVVCTVSGFVREKPYKDKTTGQQRVFHETNVFLNTVLATEAMIKKQAAA